MNQKIKYSIVIPIYNEENNIIELNNRLQETIRKLNEPSEIIFVNDGSSDNSYSKLLEIFSCYDNITIINLARNYGQTYALSAAFDKAQGDIVISMDGDLQHDPAEIISFIEKINEGYDLVSGWRKNRKDNFLTRRLPSRIANYLISLISGIQIHDFGTTFKAYRKELINNIKLYGEQHRFIPALAILIGAKITEIPISNVVRKKGKSNYGLSRTFKVILDLIMLKFLTQYSTKPLYFFGLPGLFLFLSGSVISFILILKKLFYNTHLMIEHGPLLLSAILFIMSGIQFISLGILSEMVLRTYYEGQNKKPYLIKNILAK